MATPSAYDASTPPIYGCQYRVHFVGLASDGDPVEQTTGADSEVATDSAVFVDCANELVSLTSGGVDTGFSFLDLIPAEMSGHVVVVQAKSTYAKTTPIVLYPQDYAAIDGGTARVVGSPNWSEIQFAATASDVDGAYNGCIVTLDTGTGAGQARWIIDYDGATRMATISGQWGVKPDATTGYSILMTERAGNVALILSELATVKAKTDLIGAAAVAWSSAVKPGGAVETIGGADYLDADGLALTWTITGWTGANLHGLSGKCRLQRSTVNTESTSAAADVEFTAAYTQAATTVTVKVALTAAQSAALSPWPPGRALNYAYQLVVTLASTHVLCVAAGQWTARKGLAAPAV